MTTPYPYVSGAVLLASQLNQSSNYPFNDKTASYILTSADNGYRVTMNSASATTITVNTGTFTASDTVFIMNRGAGVCTVTAGAGVTINSAGSLALSQYGGGTLVALSATSFLFFRTGTRDTLNVDYLLVGGGGAGGYQGGGGGGGGFVTGSGIIGKTTYTIKVGASGAQATSRQGTNGTASSFIGSANGGGCGAGLNGNTIGNTGGSGGGSRDNFNGGTGVSGEGNAGGNGVNNVAGGGGGGGAGGAGTNFAGGTAGGAGGAGSTNNYDGVTTTYAGGGGGWGSSTGGAAGSGGGGAGAGGTGTAGGNGSANTGGGGGAGGSTTSGNGGSGLVVVRWLTADATGLSISATGTFTTGTSGSYTWYKWTATGTLVIA